jgi:hypothetical protein
MGANMKRTTIILCSLALLGIACYAWAKTVNVVVVQGAAAATKNITADFWMTFESNADCTATELDKSDGVAGANWDATLDTESKLTCTSTSADYLLTTKVNSTSDTGTKGMLVDLSGSATAAIVWYQPSARTSYSTGFWYKTPSQQNFNWTAFHNTSNTDGTSYAVGCGDVYGAGGGAFVIGFAGVGSGITVSANTSYWVTVKWVRNGTCSLAVYTDDVGTSQVGSTITRTAADFSFQYSRWGCIGAYTVAGATSHIDNIVMDWTDATFPLIGQ